MSSNTSEDLPTWTFLVDFNKGDLLSPSDVSCDSSGVSFVTSHQDFIQIDDVVLVLDTVFTNGTFYHPNVVKCFVQNKIVKINTKELISFFKKINV
jgi:hypothetical protein